MESSGDERNSLNAFGENSASLTDLKKVMDKRQVR